MNMEKLLKFLPLAVGLVVTGALYLLGIGGPIWWGLAFAGSYFVVRVIQTPRHHPATVVIGEGLTKLDVDNTLREARAQHNILQNEAFRITNPAARAQVTEIARLVDEIIKDIKEHPEDFRTARQFFTYYLGATVKIVRNYAQLVVRPDKSPELAGSLRQVEEELQTIRGAFEKQLRVLVENDVMDLDVELQVLKKTIELEGLGPDLTKPNPPPAGQD